MAEPSAEGGRGIAWSIGFFIYIGAVLVMVIGYVGPGRWLAEAKLRGGGSYYPVASMVVLCLPLIVASVLVGRESMSLRALVEVATRGRATPYLRGVVVLSVTALALSIMGEHAFAPDLGTLTVAQVAGEKTASFYAQISGRVSEGFSMKHRSTVTTYLPLRSPGEMTGPVTLLLSGNAHEIESWVQSDEVVMHGFVNDWMPNEDRSVLVQTGIPVTAGFKVMGPRIDKQGAFKWFVGVGVAGALWSVFLLWRDWRSPAPRGP